MILQVNTKLISVLLATLLLSAAILGYSCAPTANRQKLQAEPGIGQKDIIAKGYAIDHFSKGDIFEKIGNYEKAADEYRLALVYDPGSDEIKRSLAGIYYRLNRFSEAVDIASRIESPTIDDLHLLAISHEQAGNGDPARKCYENIIKLDSLDRDANRYLSAYYNKKGDLKKSEFYFRRYLGNDSTSNRWWYHIASFYVETGQIEKATAIYEQRIVSSPEDDRGYLGLASIYEMKGDTAKADSVFHELARKRWNDAQILSIISHSLIRLGDLDGAVKLTRRITELFPDDYLTARRLALMLFSIGQFAGADSIFDRLSSKVDDDPILPYYRARIAQYDSNYFRAESLFAKTLTLDDTLFEAWLGLAQVRSRTNGVESALATLDSVMAILPEDSIKILFYKGAFLSQYRRFGEAIEFYERVLTNEPKNEAALFSLGAAYERTGRYDDSEAIFRKLIKIAPNHDGALNYLGFMLADRGLKLEEAEKLIKRALKIRPNVGAYLDSYAWVLYKKGKYKKALEYQEMAIKADSAEAELFDHLGDIYAALNNPAKARENWQKALQLNPDDEAIKRKLGK